jgi:hypothetical protein
LFVVLLMNKTGVLKYKHSSLFVRNVSDELLMAGHHELAVVEAEGDQVWAAVGDDGDGSSVDFWSG